MKKKILIIDDDSTFCKTVADALSGEKYEVIRAEDGEEGLVMLESEKPDLILLDLLMPKLNGIAFLRRLQSESGTLPLPVIITSNVTGMDSISEGVALGVRGYIIKSDETLSSIESSVDKVLAEEDLKKEDSEKKE